MKPWNLEEIIFGHYNFYLPRKLLNLVNTFDKIFPYLQPPCISDLTWWHMTAHSCNIAATPCIHHWVPPPSLPVGSPNPSLDRRCHVQGPNSLHTPKKNILNIRVRTVALKGLKTPWLCHYASFLSGWVLKSCMAAWLKMPLKCLDCLTELSVASFKKPAISQSHFQLTISKH